MKKCQKCQLYFHSLMPSGKCEDCASEDNRMNPQGQATQDTELASLREQVRQNNEVVARLQQGAPTVAQQLNARLQQDPAGTVYEIAKAAAAQASNADFETLAEMARTSAQAKDPEIWAKYGDEIQAVVDQNSTASPAMKKNVNVWQNAAHIVAGRHYRDERHDAKEAADEAAGRVRTPAVRIGDGPSAPGARPPMQTKQSESELSPEELVYAKKFRISADDYRKGKEANSQMGSALSDAEAPSPFDAVMTFDGYTGKNRKAAA